jgi:DNA-binding Lrp family transcriptional regulator
MPSHAELDDVDLRILELLSEDARRTITDIAARVSLSAAPVKRRLERLERIGVIAGYTVVLDHGRIGPAIDAFTELRFAGSTDIDDILDPIKELPEVREIFLTAGDPDALIRIRVDDVAHLRRIVTILRRSGRVSGTKTLIVLERWSPGASG